MRKNPHHNLSSLSFLPLSVKTVELIVCASFHCSPDDLSLSSFHGRLSKAIRLNHRGAEVSLGFFCVYLECLYINNDDEWSGRKSKIIHSTFRVNWNSSRKLLLFFWQQNARSKKVTLYPCTWTESFSEIQISTSTYIYSLFKGPTVKSLKLFLHVTLTQLVFGVFNFSDEKKSDFVNSETECMKLHVCISNSIYSQSLLIARERRKCQNTLSLILIYFLLSSS